MKSREFYFNKYNSLNEFMVSKICVEDIYNFKLSKKERNKLDKMYYRNHTQSVKNTMYKYSNDSNFVNDGLRNYGENGTQI